MYNNSKFNYKYNTNYISNDQMKTQLINYIYDSINLSKFSYCLLCYESELSELQKHKYFVSSNYTGSSSLLVFTKIYGKQYSFIVDRKTLSYTRQKVNINNVKTNQVHLRLDNDIYNGTILDGTYIQRNNTNTFIITDVFQFKGQNYEDISLKSKLQYFNMYLNSNYHQSEHNLNLIINKLYDLDQIDILLNRDIPKMDKTYIIKSICFYPEISGKKIIFNFDNEKRNDKPKFLINSNNMNNNINNPTIITSPSIDTIKHNQNDIQTCLYYYVPKAGIKDITYTFEIKKTENVDVYMLYIVSPVLKDGKERLKRTKVGLAYIPNAETSELCRLLFESNNNSNNSSTKKEHVKLIHCKFHKDKNKWEPISISNASKPSLNTDFDTILI